MRLNRVVFRGKTRESKERKGEEKEICLEVKGGSTGKCLRQSGARGGRLACRRGQDRTGKGIGENPKERGNLKGEITRTGKILVGDDLHTVLVGITIDRRLAPELLGR